MPELVLEGFRIPGPLQPGDCARMPKDVDRAHVFRFHNAGGLKGFLHNLMDPHPADGEEGLPLRQLRPVGIGL